MKSNRRIKWLWDKRIVTRRYPSDKPTETFPWGWYYENGTYECYELFTTENLIVSYKSYYWHISVIKYINELSYKDFREVCLFIADIDNGFVKINMQKSRVDKMIDTLYKDDSDRCPPNKVRKVIFKVGCGLERHEKRRIVGQLIGRSNRLSIDDIYTCMQYIHQSNCRVTITSLSKDINCSRPTLYKVMNDEMREEMKRLNELLKDEELQRKKLRKVQTRHTGESTSSQALDRVYNRGIDNQIPTDG